MASTGGTPKEMLARSPEFTYRRLLAAAKMAEKLGAQIMGLGAFTKVVGDAGGKTGFLRQIHRFFEFVDRPFGFPPIDQCLPLEIIVLGPFSGVVAGAAQCQDDNYETQQ